MRQTLFVIAASVLGVLAVIVLAANLNGKKLFFIVNDRICFITIGVIGLAMCGFGITRNLPDINWLSPFNFIAYILGGLAIILAIIIFSDRNILFIKNYRIASVVLMGIIAAKWLLVLFHDYLWARKL